MERATWTDERLDDLAEAMRTGFARVDQDIRDLRGEMHTGLTDLRTEMHTGLTDLRTEMNTGFADLRKVMFTFGSGIILALIGVIAAILARGA